MRKYLLFFCISVFFSVFSNANIPVRFTHYSTINGLPNDFILSIVQDNNGFMWFGTHLGIVRFDGYRFNLYQPNPLNNNSISYKHVSSMYADLHGNLWVKFTENALNRMEIETGKFYNYGTNSVGSGSISSLLINCFFEDHDSTLWIGTNSGVELYDNNSDSFIPILTDRINDTTHPGNNVIQFSDDSFGNIWLLSTRGIGCIKKDGLSIQSLGEIVDKPELDFMNITSISSNRTSKLWFTTLNKGVFCYDVSNGKLINYFKDQVGFKAVYIDKKENVYLYSSVGNTLYFLDNENNQVKDYTKYFLFDSQENADFLRMAEDKSGNLWISSTLGLDMFSPTNGLIHYKNDVLQEQSLSSNTINYIFIDETNNLWVSNYRRGLDKAELNQKPFRKQFTNPKQTNNVFSGTNITAVMEDSQGFLWVGEYGKSIIRIDKNSDNYVPVQIKNFQVNFSALYEDSHGDIWVGSYGAGIERIDPKTLEITYSSNFSEHDDYREWFWGVRKFVEDKQGNIWFASTIGIQKWERKTGKIVPYSYMFDPHNPDQGFYRTVFIDKEGMLWSGSYNGGLARHDTENNTVKRYTHKDGDNNSISGNGVYVIFEESDSTFLIGTTLGLNRFNKKTEKFSLVKHNLFNYSIYSIIQDNHGDYWMASDNGLIYYNTYTGECVFYNQGDGLPANEFNTTASSLGKDGTIYIGSPKGLLYFKPENFTQNPYPAKPTITNLRVSNSTILPGDTLNGRILLNKQIWKTAYLELKYYENDFEFQFSAMHYAVPENNRFWYMLEGYKDEWVPIELNRGWASFTGLAPGEYTFRLKATNNDGILCSLEDEVSITIKILPPFWKTPWFKVGLILLLIVTVVIVFRWRFRRVNKLNTQLEKMVDKRTSELQDANYMLMEHREELTNQKESLEITNKSLLEIQEKVIAQNKELDLHRNKLEVLVEERTAELNKALIKAEESDRLKSSFLANVSHEIRTPLNAIMGFSSLLKDQYFDNEVRDQYIDVIVGSGESLLNLINNILDLSKFQSNQLALNKDLFNLKDLLLETFVKFQAEYNNPKNELKLNIERLKNDLLVETDEIRFEQVIVNLLSNATKFTCEGLIELGVHSITDQELTIFVKDTGIGIPAKKGEEIFGHFAKIEDDPDNLYRGAGLGLTICNSIIGLWGGKLWFESIENKGSIFFFTHPVSKKQTDKPSKKQNLEETVDLNGLNILIAEDEESNYKLLLAYLSEYDVNISWARNGLEACDMVNNIEPDIIIMDIKMPLMSGDEAAKQIKSHHPHIPIIAQTAFNFTFDGDQLKNKIFDQIISKPIDHNELIRKIGMVI